MIDRLPPLTALRAFEAAARHLSFAKAADELNVTPAALSFQIKSLEEHFGGPLFHRLNRAVMLTEAGELLAPGASVGFEALQAAWRTARKSQDTSVITVTAGPAFTAKWLAPRLFAFAEAHPEIDLRFAASLKLMDFSRDDIDIAIRFGPVHEVEEADLYSEKFMDEWATPMMHPDLAVRYPTIESLAHAPLLHQTDLDWLPARIDWPAWFKAAGMTVDEFHGAAFSQADHALDAAAAGAGVVLGRVTLADKALKEGRLVAPFPIMITTKAHYRVLCPQGAELRPHIAAFLKWLRAEMRNIGDHGAGFEFVASEDLTSGGT